MGWQTTPFTLPLLISAGISLFISIYAFNKQNAPGRIYFSLFMFLSFIWSFGYAMELSSISLSMKIFWFYFESVGFVFIAPALLFFAFEYTGNTRFRKIKYRIIILLPAIIIITAIFSNPWHHLFLKTTTLKETIFYLDMYIVFGPMFWIHIIYSYSIVFVVTLLFFNAWRRGIYLHQRQAGALLTSSLIPWIASILTPLGFNPFNLEMATFGFTFTGMIIIYGLFHYRLLDIVPVARNSIVENMSDMVLVLDNNFRLLDINKTASIYFCLSNKVWGQSIDDSLAKWDPLITSLRNLNPEISSFEYGDTIKDPENPRFFDIYISPIYNQSKEITARVLVMHDITKRKADENMLRLTQSELESIVARQTQELEISNIALKASEERLRVFMQSAMDGFFLWNNDLKLELINKAGIDLYFPNTTMVNLLGHSLRELLSPLYSEDVLESLIKVSKNGGYLHQEVVLQNSMDTKNYEELKAFRTGEGLGMIVNDITKRKTDEAELNAALEEKEVLLKEVHHRVKNNMQIITSLLSLQTGYITDEKSRFMLEESKNRIRSMAMIHETLYRSKNFAKLDFKEYTVSLINRLCHSFYINQDTFKCVIKMDNIFLGMDKAIPCGLLINELVTNTFKHAFNGRETGQLAIELKVENGKYYLCVSDDGNGLPEDFNLKSSTSLGVQIINALAGQLNSQIHIENETGAKFIFIFNV